MQEMNVTCFNCKQKNNLERHGDNFSPNSYLRQHDLDRNVFNSYIDMNREYVTLFRKIFANNCIDLDNFEYLLMEIKRGIMKIQYAQENPSNYCEKSDIYKTRNEICKSLQLLRHALYSPVSSEVYLKLIELFLDLLKDSITNVDLVVNEYLILEISLFNSTLRTLFHLELDVFYLLLTILYKNTSDIELNVIIKKLLQFLIKISESFYKKNICVPEDAFLCICVKELWLLLQILLENNSQLDFWEYFNEAADEYNTKFQIWLLSKIANLHYYDYYGFYDESNKSRMRSNVPGLIKYFKSLLHGDISKEEDIYFCLKLSENLLSYMWIKQVSMEIYQNLWEYFWKKTDLLPIYPKNVKKIVEMILSPQKPITSYEFFLLLLCRHFKYFTGTTLWDRFKGRVYSRLSSKNITELNDKRIYNLLFLFIHMANVLPSEADVCEKMNSLLSDLGLHKQSTCLSLYQAFIIVYVSKNGMTVKQDLVLRNLSENILKVITILIGNSSYDDILRDFIQGMEYEQSASLFLGEWIIYYTSFHSKRDLSHMLDMLLMLCHKDYNGEEWQKKCNDFVLPCLRNLAYSDSYQVGKLAGEIVLKNLDTVMDHLDTFTAERSSFNTCLLFLTNLLNDIKYQEYCCNNSLLEIKTIQCWIKCCVIFGEERMSITNETISTFPVMKKTLNINNEPISFRRILILLQEQISPQTLFNLRSFCNSIFSSIVDLVKNCNDTNALKQIYTNIGHIVFHCSTLLYSRGKTLCILTSIVSNMLLPLDVLTGKKPNQMILEALEKTYPLYVKGIAKMDYRNDPYLERTLCDLITKYMVHFEENSSPILKCFDEDNLAIFVLESVAIFMKRSKSDTFILDKILSFINNVVQNKNIRHELLSAFISKIVNVLLEYIMLEQNKRNKCVQILQNIQICNYFFKARTDLINSLIRFTEKQLAFHSKQYFSLICDTVTCIFPTEIEALLPFLKKHINNVEKLRGVGYDNNLRNGLKMVEEAVAMSKRK